MEVSKEVIEIINFHKFIEENVQELQHGQITVNVIIKDGLPVNESLSLVKSKRIKYKYP